MKTSKINIQIEENIREKNNQKKSDHGLSKRQSTNYSAEQSSIPNFSNSYLNQFPKPQQTKFRKVCFTIRNNK